jgi:WD40 repeat protein
MRHGGWLIGWLVLALAGPGPQARAQTAGARSTRRPDVWAIIVGVGSPLDPKLKAQSSRDAVPQALRLLGWFGRTAGWDRRNLLLLTDFGGSNDPGTVESPAPNITPTKKNLDWAFREWLKPRAKPDDLIVFYFAGQARSLAPKNAAVSPEYHLLPNDALSENLAASGWSLDRALDVYAKQAKYHIVCWLGTTLRWETPPGARNVRGPDSVAQSRDWLHRLARWPGVTVWLASDGSPATAPADLATAFTQALLAGFGTGDHKQNLSGCLQSLRHSAQLKGFRAIGGVPPHLNLWSDRVERPDRSPQPEMVLQVGHADRISDLVSTPDGRLVLTASQDSTIRVWSTAQNALLRVLTGHSVGTTALRMSDDSRWLISGGGRGEVLVHDLARDFARKTVVRQPHDSDSRIVRIAMLPDGAHVITLDSHARAFIWDLSSTTLTARPWLPGVECREVASGGRGQAGSVAAWLGDGTIHLCGPAGAGGAAIRAPAGKLTGLSVSPDGRLVALAYDDGRVVLRETKGGRQSERKGALGPVRQLLFVSSSRLAAGHDAGVGLFAIDEPLALGAETALRSDRGVEKLAVSPDGGLLAACALDTGALWVWKLDRDTPTAPILADPNAGVTTLAFSSDGHALLTGTRLGSVASRPIGQPGAAAPRTYAALRGKIKHLATSPGRGFLLMFNDLYQAQLWDLSQRTCRRLPGMWSSGVFLGEDTLVLADRPRREQPGRLVRVDRKTLAVDTGFFAYSKGAFKVDAETRFEAVTLSPDGTRVAAAASASQQPLVCVWETRSGRLTHWITGATLNDPVSALGFSSDARLLLSAGDSPEAKLWDLKPGDGPLRSPVVTFADTSARNITAVAVQPGSGRQMVTGHSDGRLLLWNWSDRKSRQATPLQVLAERFFEGAVHAVTFTPDGRYLAATGDGTMILLAEMGASVTLIRDLGTPPHHLEQINAAAVWTGPIASRPPGPRTPGAPANVERPPVLITGSDDTTVKFWDLEKRTLLATFRAAATSVEQARPAGAARDLEWVLYTPDGHFDASHAGRALVRFRQAEQAHALEQFDNTKLYSFELTDLLRSGRRTEPVTLAPPAPLAIDPPLRDDPAHAETHLTISLGSADLSDLRLYHNGIPIPTGLEDARPPLPEQFTVQVRLLPGTNRFYVMASRDGAFDSRSADVEVDYEGTLDPGRLHVVALGVGNYKRETLLFAAHDAERLSRVLSERGLNPGQGHGARIPLMDDQVTAGRVTEAFTTIAREVRGRPQDTVVVFLAGHTGVFDNDRFCLLLPKYPFAEGSPLVVAARGANPPTAPGAKVTEDHFLPYSMLAGNLMRLDALNRLVIVDACQAESILVDPQVAAIHKWMEIGSRKARTAYLMAARRGEPALEVKPLGHGLFTYTLLRGMREVPLRDEPKAIADLKLRPDADYNGDNVITSAELDAYVKETLPPIAAVFPKLFVRGTLTENLEPRIPRGGAKAATAGRNLEQSLRLQTSPVSFPLIHLNRTTAVTQ